MPAPRTLGELEASGYRPVSVREEMRRNLLARLERGTPLLPGIVGFDDSVVPGIENAVLSGHHIVFLGERGQAKSRIIRALTGLLDEQVPVVEGCALNDDPLAPICRECRRRRHELGAALPVAWLGRDRRLGEKLATPDVTIADLIGEIDPIKVAEGRYLADEETIHYGLIPRCHRGLFAINELPDLSEKVQVGLFNLMEEKDVQIKGHKIRLPVDVVFVASANPEDYTSRGRIITPLKDRFDARIRTHYPRRLDDEIAIMVQEQAGPQRGARPVFVPGLVLEILARFTFEARACGEINQASGVSVRMSINNCESVVSNAEKRAARCGEAVVVPRPSDLHAIATSTLGKLEFEYGADEAASSALFERLLERAVLAAFDARWKVADLEPVCAWFARGGSVEVSDAMPAAACDALLQGIDGLAAAVQAGVGDDPRFAAAGAELVLAGLHLHRRLNCEVVGGHRSYRA